MTFFLNLKFSTVHSQNLNIDLYFEILPKKREIYRNSKGRINSLDECVPLLNQIFVNWNYFSGKNS